MTIDVMQSKIAKYRNGARGQNATTSADQAANLAIAKW